MIHEKNSISDDSSTNEPRIKNAANRSSVIRIDNETIYPSKLGNFISSAQQTSSSVSSSAAIISSSLPVSSSSSQRSQNGTDQQSKLVCYYSSPQALNLSHQLYPNQIDPYLCTHINVGVVVVENNTMVIDNTLKELFKQMTTLKRVNADLKILIWVGGPSDSPGFVDMIKNHANRKQFIRSLKSTLETYRLDGVDLDWEFPVTHNRQRQHFSQLLHEIRREYEREHRTYLLSVAVAAPEGIVYFAYDINEINQYCDYVNIMTYDYHMYAKSAPFTGILSSTFFS